MKASGSTSLPRRSASYSRVRLRQKPSRGLALGQRVDALQSGPVPASEHEFFLRAAADIETRQPLTSQDDGSSSPEDPPRGRRFESSNLACEPEMGEIGRSKLDHAFEAGDRVRLNLNQTLSAEERGRLNLNQPLSAEERGRLNFNQPLSAEEKVRLNFNQPLSAEEKVRLSLKLRASRPANRSSGRREAAALRTTGCRVSIGHGNRRLGRISGFKNH